MSYAEDNGKRVREEAVEDYKKELMEKIEKLVLIIENEGLEYIYLPQIIELLK